MLSVRDLGIDLRDFAVRGVSFDVEDGDYFVLLGASGVGKTVLLELLAGLITPDEGKILHTSASSIVAWVWFTRTRRCFPT